MMKIRVLHAQILIFIFMLFIGSFSYLYGDDFDTANALFSDIINVTKTAYFIWNARVPAIILCHLLLIKSFAYITLFLTNCATAFFFAFFLKKTAQLAFNKEQLSMLGFCFFSLCLSYYLIYTQDWDQVLIWKTGVIVYFYGAVLGLLMIDYLFIKQKELLNKKSYTFYFILGVMVGWYHELIALLMLSMFVLFFIHQYYSLPITALLKKFKIHIICFAGTILGFSFILTAPGTWARKRNGEALKKLSELTLFNKVDFAFSHYFAYPTKKYLAVFVVLTILFILLKYLKSRTINDMEKKIIFNFSLFFTSLLVLASFAYAYEGHIGGRVTFFYDVLLFVVFWQALFYLTQNKIRIFTIQEKYNKLILITLTLALAYPFSQYYFSYRHYQDQIDAFKSLKNKSELDIVLYQQPLSSIFTYYLILNSEPKSWENLGFSRYYGIKSVVLLPKPNEILNHVNKKVVYTDHCMGSIDAINSIPGATSFIAHRFLFVSGWLVSKSITSNVERVEPVMVLTDKEGKHVFVKTSQITRVDVGSFFKNTQVNASGYSSSVDVSALSGDYSLSLGYIDGDAIKICSLYNIPGTFNT